MAYLRYAQHLSVARLARELHGVSLTTGTVANLYRRVAERLATESARRRDQTLALPSASAR